MSLVELTRAQPSERGFREAAPVGDFSRPGNERGLVGREVTGDELAALIPGIVRAEAAEAAVGTDRASDGVTRAGDALGQQVGPGPPPGPAQMIRVRQLHIKEHQIEPALLQPHPRRGPALRHRGAVAGEFHGRQVHLEAGFPSDDQNVRRVDGDRDRAWGRGTAVAGYEAHHTYCLR